MRTEIHERLTSRNLKGKADLENWYILENNIKMNLVETGCVYVMDQTSLLPSLRLSSPEGCRPTVLVYNK